MTYTRRPQPNIDPIDQFTPLHIAAGWIYGAMGLSWWATLGSALTWEVAERWLKTRTPSIFPVASQDSLANSTFDLAAVMSGWGAMQGVKYAAALRRIRRR